VKTTINVTQEHINKGVQVKCTKCPVALAIQDVCKPKSEVHVGVYILIGGLCADTPASAIRFIKEFDVFGTGRPFSFDLDIPDELLAEAK
jgi:hypothetical protein